MASLGLWLGLGRGLELQPGPALEAEAATLLRLLGRLGDSGLPTGSTASLRLGLRLRAEADRRSAELEAVGVLGNEGCDGARVLPGGHPVPIGVDAALHHKQPEQVSRAGRLLEDELVRVERELAHRASALGLCVVLGNLVLLGREAVAQRVFLARELGLRGVPRRLNAVAFRVVGGASHADLILELGSLRLLLHAREAGLCVGRRGCRLLRDALAVYRIALLGEPVLLGELVAPELVIDRIAPSVVVELLLAKRCIRGVLRDPVVVVALVRVHAELVSG